MLTRPTFPTPIWFHPVRFILQDVADGIDVFLGPEVENAGQLAPADLATKQRQWIDAVAAAGAWCVLKNPVAPIPDNCYAFMLGADEPNAKGVKPASLVAERDRLRALSPTMPIVLSLAGDAVTSANFNNAWEKQLYLDFITLVGDNGILTVDAYSTNRNASHYPLDWTAKAVAKLKGIGAKNVWAWLEVSDQQLPPPNPPDVNREPSPDEMQAEWDACRAAGAGGIGWFMTAQHGDWPDRYRPVKNRGGHSVQSQYDRMRALNLSVKTVSQPVPVPVPVPPTPTPAQVPTVGQLADMAANQAQAIAGLTADVLALKAWRDKVQEKSV